jgi:dTDP-4-amino-4,6-dideoxygalactose transaminase
MIPDASSNIIPVSSPGRRVARYRSLIIDAVERVLDSGWYILGKEVEHFENEFAAWNQSKFSVGVANGTDAISLALLALDVKPGDEVITVSHSAVATAAAITSIGAVPKFADIDLQTRGMDVSSAKSLITERTRAIIPVHIYGHPVAIKDLCDLAAKKEIPVIEDCAQAHGATWQVTNVGNFGIMAAFSFYPTKNLGALGDAGALITNNEALAYKLRALRQYGWKQRYISEQVGTNSRLDELQASILRIFLKDLTKDNQRRRTIAQKYLQSISGPKIVAPIEMEGAEPVYHLFVVETENRGHLIDFFQSRGIETALHYPFAIHQQAGYKQQNFQSLPNTEYLYKRIVSLPMFPELTDYEVGRVCEALRDYCL